VIFSEIFRIFGDNSCQDLAKSPWNQTHCKVKRLNIYQVNGPLHVTGSVNVADTVHKIATAPNFIGPHGGRWSPRFSDPKRCDSVGDEHSFVLFLTQLVTKFNGDKW
jgi:hypothetical protein